ncbi:MAG: type VI secretion system contractile sheath small subunit [Planctomycetota bacterium]|nr:type VI secretion system contractile sheath small subunit [Planctomycetota bacterium]
MAESNIWDKGERVRKARVHLKFDVETEGAYPADELPFVVGVMGDYSGNDSGAEFKPLRDRKFVDIDRDNFGSVMSRIAPGLKFRVKDELKGDGSEFEAQLAFRSLDDFLPSNVAAQIPQLKAMLDQRDKLKTLLSKLGSSPKAGDLMDEILKNTELQDQLRRELGEANGPTGGEPPAG